MVGQHTSRQGYGGFGGQPTRNQQLINNLNQRYGPTATHSRDDVAYASGRYAASGTNSLNNLLQNPDAVLENSNRSLSDIYSGRIADLDGRLDAQRNQQINDLKGMTNYIAGEQRMNDWIRASRAQNERDHANNKTPWNTTMTSDLTERYNSEMRAYGDKDSDRRAEWQMSREKNQTQQNIAETQAMSGLLGSALNAGFSGYGSSNWRWF